MYRNHEVTEGTNYTRWHARDLKKIKIRGNGVITRRHMGSVGKVRSDNVFYLESAFPFPGAFSNFARHLSSCLNNTIASIALGAP